MNSHIHERELSSFVFWRALALLQRGKITRSPLFPVARWITGTVTIIVIGLSVCYSVQKWATFHKEGKKTGAAAIDFIDFTAV